MRRLQVFLLRLVILIVGLNGNALAQETQETVISFSTDNAKMEDNPKQHNYCISIFSPDGQWKLQLNYHSDSMFGTFGNDHFDLNGDGRYYNFARNPKNDMVFYSFTDMVVTVTDEGTLYRVKADCKTKNSMRFLVEATIAAPKAKESRSDNLGYARIVPNVFYGTIEVHAENDNYKLSYGIAGNELEGTFYRADLLMPELTEKKSGRAIPVITATAVHKQEGERTEMAIDILSEDLVMYHLEMWNGPHEVEVEEEIVLRLEDTFLQDLTEMYGCYQLGAENKDYAIAIALAPDAFRTGKKELTRDDFVLPYTNIVYSDTGLFEEIDDITGSMELGEETFTLRVDVLCQSGALYHITMVSNVGGFKPHPEETVEIDFGHVAVLDYSRGIGIIGVGAIVPDKYQIRAYFYAHELDGEFTNEEFIPDLCDVMVVGDDGRYVFHDASYVTAKTEKQTDGRTLITIDMLGVDNVMYHATMTLDPLSCLEGGDYDLSHTNQTQMVGVVETEYDETCDYIIQLQNNIENIYDKNGRIKKDASAYAFSFYFNQKEASIAGEYGYSDYTMQEDTHFFYEKGCEVRIAPVAGTLSIKPVEPLTLRSPGMTYNTWLYELSFQFVGTNGAIYRGKGTNYLLCIDASDMWVEMDESSYDRLDEVLAEQGLKVKKVLKDGRIIVEKDGKAYDMNGKMK